MSSECPVGVVSMSCQSRSCQSRSCQSMSCRYPVNQCPANQCPANVLSINVLSINVLSINVLSINVLSINVLSINQNQIVRPKSRATQRLPFHQLLPEGAIPHRSLVPSLLNKYPSAEPRRMTRCVDTRHLKCSVYP